MLRALYLAAWFMLGAGIVGLWVAYQSAQELCRDAAFSGMLETGAGSYDRCVARSLNPFASQGAE